MAAARAHLQLGNSWVVEGEDDSSEDKTKEEDPDFTEPSPKPKAVPPLPARKTTKSPEPELVMPSLDITSTDGSWADTAQRDSRKSRSPRAIDRTREMRKRKPRQSDSSSSPEMPVYSKPFKKSTPKSSFGSDSDMLQAVVEHVGSMVSWSFDVLGRALRLLKTPISYMLAIWMLFGLLVIARNLVTTSIYASLSPICRIPGTSLLNLPFCPPGAGGGHENIPPAEFDQLMTVQSKFEEVLVESAGSVSLPMDMKRGEASIRDLRQLVRYSHINSK